MTLVLCIIRGLGGVLLQARGINRTANINREPWKGPGTGHLGLLVVSSSMRAYDLFISPIECIPLFPTKPPVSRVRALACSQSIAWVLPPFSNSWITMPLIGPLI